MRHKNAWSRVGASAGDQACTSLTSLLLTTWAAATLSSASFGVFSACVAGLLLLQSVTRAVGPEAVAVTAAEDRTERLQDESAGLGASIAVSLVGLVVMVLLAIMLGDDQGVAVAVVGAISPVVTLADARRGMWIAARKPRLAVRQSSATLVFVVSILAGLLVLGLITASWILAAWGLASLSAILVARMSELRVRLDLRWLRRRAATIGWLLVEAMSQSMVGQFVFLAIAALLSAASLGAIRGALLVFAPLTVALQGLGLLIPAESRRARANVVRKGVAVAAVGICMTIGSLIAALNISSVWGVAALLLGDTAAAARTLLVPIGCFVGASAISMVVSLAIRGVHGAAASGAVRLLFSPLNALLAPSTAIISGDLTMVAWALAAGQTATAAGWVVAFCIRSRSRP